MPSLAIARLRLSTMWISWLLCSCSYLSATVSQHTSSLTKDPTVSFMTSSYRVCLMDSMTVLPLLRRSCRLMPWSLMRFMHFGHFWNLGIFRDLPVAFKHTHIFSLWRKKKYFIFYLYHSPVLFVYPLSSLIFLPYSFQPPLCSHIIICSSSFLSLRCIKRV
jgi:hypothetical protein